ncbi:phosphate/phosphite/phosphonate ABC transporter substrate-binding protein [Marinobacter qingdaonensis]|uniref:Phosphate/phosphite/phosphonate ABC transporter substrate-binding protein n=1 Tax=Marinobacter qingdaonensis TaxID=3108486 RepID=A0ABU5NUU6_9GAMM|nr:phosphate/phosphite/phosphonate ABC transporter substrate-binding protein [Marinobacter sp. ASW11-75]MEA1079579.1 phosphate/phosphite/phosphonate ABC transporter substrate-binding protein [Marinobacter sp. ASW11-75]
MRRLQAMPRQKTLMGILVLFLLAPHVVSAQGTAESNGTNTLTFGVVPQQAASKLARAWVPMLKNISDRSGLTVDFATAPDIPTFEERLARGEYDIAYMNPYHFTLFNENPGYQALARARDHRIRGIIVVRRESGITSLSDLAGQALAFPAPRAFAATLVTRSHLETEAAGYTAHFVSSHDSVYRSVASGRFVAGGGIQRTLNALEAGVREELRVLWRSPGYTPHAIAVHPRVNEETRRTLLGALTGLEDSEAGLQILEPLRMKGFEAAANADWDDVRRLNISAQ